MKRFLLIVGVLVALFFAKDFLIHLIKVKRSQEYTIYQTMKAQKITEDCIREKVDKQICELYIQTLMAKIWSDASMLVSKIRDKEDLKMEADNVWGSAISTGRKILQNRGENFVILHAKKDREMCVMLSKLFNGQINSEKFDCNNTNATFAAMYGLWYDLEFLYRLQK